MSGLVESGALVGRTIAQYRLTGFLGRGGMGEVYEAFDTRLRRSVALKFLAADDDAAASHRRLLREARAASTIDHPGIVGIFEVGEFDDRSFIAMELVHGRSLADVLADDGPLSVSEAIDVARHAAEAMDAAHASGVVHRDLKPKNLMVTDQGRVKVLDFGIARPSPLAEIDTFDTEPRHSTGDATPGTLVYMSPEQLLGEAVDARSDVFSLGIVLFEMLTGRRPFERSTESGFGPAAYLHQLLYRQPKSLSDLEPDVPPRLERIVGKMLAKSPDDRQQSMAEVAEELSSLSVAASAQTRSGPRNESVDTPRIRRGVARWAMPLLVVAPVALAGGYAWQAQLWNSAVEVVPEAMQDVPCALKDHRERTPIALWEAGNQFFQRFDRQHHIQLAVECFDAAISLRADYAPAHSSLARAYQQLYRKKKDEVWRIRAEASAREAIQLDPHLTHAQVTVALGKIWSGELESAEADLLQMSRLDPDEPDIPFGLAKIAQARGRFDEMVHWLQRAASLDPDRWDLWSRLGDAHYRAGDWKDAGKAYEKSLEVTPDNFVVHRNLAAVRHQQGDFEGTVDALQRSLAIQPSAAAYSNLGTAYFFKGFFKEAADAFEDALEMRPDHYVRWANLADALRQVPGRREEARQSYERAAELLRERLIVQPEDPALRSRLALYLARSGDGAAARAVLPTEAEYPTYYEVPPSWYQACLVFESLGERGEALHALEQALRLGHPIVEAKSEPELAALREDLRYHRLVQEFGG